MNYMTGLLGDVRNRRVKALQKALQKALR